MTMDHCLRNSVLLAGSKISILLNVGFHASSVLLAFFCNRCSMKLCWVPCVSNRLRTNEPETEQQG